VPPNADTPQRPGDATPVHHRRVRSFVLRQGRMSPAQQRALDTLWPRYGVAYAPIPLDFAALFGRSAPVVLEIGCGMGETTVEIAAANRDVDFLGVEVHMPGVGSLMRRAAQCELSNLRVIAHDAVEVVATMIPPGSLAAVHVFFPDPWPKKRHHKRRLLQAPFVELAARRLAGGGILHVATDWQEYADEVLGLLSRSELLSNTAAGFAPRPPWRPETKFERRGRRLGHGVWDIIFRKA
jgi:tRNA (guanine-N7-)-methyltransferase